MSFILTVIGLLLLAASLAAIVFGVYMATDPRTREQGRLFAIWWVPGVATASGVLMRDGVTFTVGMLCFLVAGAVFVFEGRSPRKPTVRRKGGSWERPGGERRSDSEKTTKENTAGGGYGRAAS